ncbi:MAG: SH3 domain-containing protein [Chloroflexi bacterium]|nr:SH3 domain-containing protein [Chloroflexota bacterium]
MSVDDREPPEDRPIRSSRRGTTDRLPLDDVDDDLMNLRRPARAARPRRTRSGLTLAEAGEWLRQGGWKFLVIALALVIVAGMFSMLGQPAEEPIAITLPTREPAAAVRITPVGAETPVVLPTVPPEPTAAEATAAPEAPTAEPTPAGERLQVSGTGEQGLFLRPAPETTLEPIKTLYEGTIVTVAGPDSNEGGRMWKYVRDAEGAEGFAAADFLIPAP